MLPLSDYPPAAHLRPWIRMYRFISTAEARLNRVLPNTSVAMAFRLHGQITQVHEKSTQPLPFATCSGLQGSARMIGYADHAAAVIVLFRENGLAAFTGLPHQELYGQTIGLDALYPATVLEGLQEQLLAAKDQESSCRILDQFFSRQLRRQEEDRLIESALASIQAAKGQVQIKALADSHYLSQDAFEKRFRKVTGATPKQYATIIRMQALIAASRGAGTLTGLAYEHGFYDQPHFNRQFRKFTGQAPRDFFQTAAYW